MMMVETRTDEFVGLPEVAERLGVHRATVNDMARRGRLPAQRDGAHWLVRRSDLDRFAAEYVRPSNAPSRRDHSMPTSAPRICELLREFDSADAAELAILLDLHEGNVRKHLRLMEVAGIVLRRPDGQWVLRHPDGAAEIAAPAALPS